MDKNFTLEEIICLHWAGRTSQEILRTKLADFDRLYDDQPEEFDEYLDRAEELLDKQEALGIRTLSWQDELYPKALTAIRQDAPPLIHLLGNMDLLNEPKAVAIIGARAADKEGLSAAYSLGAKYAKQGEVVVSGLALGCDAAAHEGCLSVLGKTIAIVASGLNITHPKEHADLQRRILDAGGLLLSEQLFGAKASSSNLIARNRLQAALSHSVILAQCPESSGSMKTMNFARKYRKECLAVSFPQRTEANGGNARLIRDGLAKPITV